MLGFIESFSKSMDATKISAVLEFFFFFDYMFCND